MIISLAVSHGWPLRHLDIRNAFLHNDLPDNVYIQQSQEFIDSKFPHYVYKLHKATYGLKQAPRVWFAQLSSWLIGYGFPASQTNPSLFILNHGDLKMFMLIYVDYIVVTTSQPSAIDSLIFELSIAFSIKDLGHLSFFLGLEVDYSSSDLLLSQWQYIKELLVRSNMLYSKPVTSPVAASIMLSQYDSSQFEDTTRFRSIVEGLQYLSLKRPDIAFAINNVCQFMHYPKVPHWTAVKKIVRYLKATLNYRLLLKSISNVFLQAYTIADWAGCRDDRRST